MLNILIISNSRILSLDIKNRIVRLGHTVAGIIDNLETFQKFLNSNGVDLIVFDSDFDDNSPTMNSLLNQIITYRMPYMLLISNIDEAFFSDFKHHLPEVILNKPFTDKDFNINFQLVSNKIESYRQIRQSAISDNFDLQTNKEINNIIQPENKGIVQSIFDKDILLISILNSANLWVTFFDKEGSVQIWNKAARNITGFSQTEIENLEGFYNSLFPDATYREFIIKDFNQLIMRQSDINIPVVISTKMNRVKSISVLPQEIIDENENVVGLLWIAYDITQKTLEEANIKAKLEEKEILIKEIHHRVKNNLQIMNSLVNLQARYIEDQKSIEHFRETQNRIRTLALIQESIYQSKDFTNLDFTEFIRCFLKDLLQFYNASDSIKQIICNKSVYIRIKTVVPLALMFNEILSNSIKYAFNAQQTEKFIEISCHTRKKDKLTFIISDNGTGIPSNINLDTPDSLGLQLIEILATQIEAQVEIDTKNGTKYTIVLPGKSLLK